MLIFMGTRLDIIMLYCSVALLLLLPLVAQSHPHSHIDDEGLPIDCEDVFKNGSIHSGVYTIYPEGEDSAVEVYCEMGCPENENMEEGHWTVILKRMDGSVNFDRNYAQYSEGFGYKDGEYWLGLESMHLLTIKGDGNWYSLRVDVEDFAGSKIFALYPTFRVESASDGYKLHIVDFINGGAGDSLKAHNGKMFSTFDRDQDIYWGQCAAGHVKGGFWFHQCQDANTNGQYQWQYHNSKGSTGLYWSTWSSASLKAITLKIKRVHRADEATDYS